MSNTFQRTAAATLLLFAAWQSAGAQVIYNSASTVGESRARGRADVIRSQGQFQVDRATARNLDAEARSAELDNRYMASDTYFNMRNLNKQQRFGDYEAKRQKNLQKRLFRYGQEGRPKRPTQRDLDSITGKIRWPFPLQAPDYKERRASLDKLFKDRAYNEGHIGYEGLQNIKRETGIFQEDIKDAIRAKPPRMEPQDYTESKAFIKRLTYEARHASS